MPYLAYISDSHLEQAVQAMLDSSRIGLDRATNDFNRNVIDPFSIAFEMAVFNTPTVSAWVSAEKARQAQKSLGQALGVFHQSVLGFVEGWQNLGVGNIVDLVCHQRKIVAEVKNKHNTVTGAKLVGVYDDLHELVMRNSSIYHGYTAYYVEILPKNNRGYNMEFTPSDRATSSRRQANPAIRKIDGKRFYELVTGQADALDQLQQVLPQVIANVTDFTFAAPEAAEILRYYRQAYQ